MATHQPVPEEYLQPVADGLPMRDSGAWVVEKLHYVQRYIDMFTTSMHGKPWRNIRYIDLFAGPGKCKIRETGNIVLGSPLLAATTRHSFTKYVFVDYSTSLTEALRERCKATAVSPRIRFQIGDANVIAKGIADEIIREDAVFIKERWPSLNLAFLDPEGLELEWTTVKTLARVQKMDLIIHYSQFGLTLNLEQLAHSQEETAIDRFFGDDSWRDTYCTLREKGARTGRIHRHLIDHYKSKLAKLGYQHIIDSDSNPEPVIRNKQRNAPLYRLLFASKHKLGHKFWKEGTGRDVYGQRRLL